MARRSSSAPTSSARRRSQRRMIVESLEARCLLAAVNDVYSTPFATVLTQTSPGVLANDTPTGSTVTHVQGNAGSVGAPTSSAAGATVTLAADGSFTYDPTTSRTLG